MQDTFGRGRYHGHQPKNYFSLMKDNKSHGYKTNLQPWTPRWTINETPKRPRKAQGFSPPKNPHHFRFFPFFSNNRHPFASPT